MDIQNLRDSIEFNKILSGYKDQIEVNLRPYTSQYSGAVW